jgi:hypothetical protein
MCELRESLLFAKKFGTDRHYPISVAEHLAARENSFETIGLTYIH